MNSEYLESITRQGMDDALELIQQSFEENPSYLNNLPYHNTVHTKDVVRRTATFVEVVAKTNPSILTFKDKMRAIQAASFHDTVQDWEAVLGQFQGCHIIKRKRFTGSNEEKSAETAEKFMKSHAMEDPDYQVVKSAILATTPGFDVALQTVTHPLLTDTSPLIARIVALADISTLGFDGPPAIIDEADRLFREENLDILANIAKGATISETKLDWIKERVLQWMHSQTQFAKGREKLLPKELAYFPTDAQESLMRLFNKFSLSQEVIEETIEVRSKMSPITLLTEIGYFS
jgi:hypothetical protein